MNTATNQATETAPTFYSVKWYEPLTPRAKSERITMVCDDGHVREFTLPSGRGLHEQTVKTSFGADCMRRALKAKGYALINITEKGSI